MQKKLDKKQKQLLSPNLPLEKGEKRKLGASQDSLRIFANEVSKKPNEWTASVRSGHSDGRGISKSSVSQTQHLLTEAVYLFDFLLRFARKNSEKVLRVTDNFLLKISATPPQSPSLLPALCCSTFSQPSSKYSLLTFKKGGFKTGTKGGIKTLTFASKLQREDRWAPSAICKLQMVPICLISVFFLIFILFPYTTHASFNAANTESLRSGLVGWWTFDSKDTPWTSATAATTLDKSGKGNTGTLTNMNRTTASVIGKLGQALKFNGTNSYINLNGSTDTRLQNTVTTISMWAFIRSVGANGYAELYAVTGGGDSTGIMWRPGGIGIAAGGGVCCGYFYNYNVSVSLPYNQWKHIVVIIDQNSRVGKVYVDGVYKGQTASWSSYSLATTSINIGKNSMTSNTTDYLNGNLDDVRIYNRALSASEIKKLYNMGAGTEFNTSDIESLTSGLLGYWNFDAANVNWKTGAVIDGSHNNKIGYFVNMATSTSRAIGKIGQGLFFSSARNGYILVNKGTGAGGFNGLSVPAGGGAGAPYSISLWVKDDTAAVSLGSSHRLISWYDSTNGNNIQLGFGTDAGLTNRVFYIGESPNSSGDVPKQATVGSVGLGWHHVVATSDGLGAFNMYLDDNLSNGGGNGVSTPTSNTTNNGNLYIGQRGTSTGFLRGYLDEVRVYNRTLTASDVDKLYNMGKEKFGVSASPGNLNKGLVGWWTFDAKDLVGGVMDRSGQGNNGILSLGTLGTTATSSAVTIGKLGQGLKFDGKDDYVKVGNNNNFNIGTGDFSVALWVKPNNYTNWPQLLNKSVWTVSGWMCYLDQATGDVVCGTMNGTNHWFSSHPVPLNKWTHIVFIRNGVNQAFYLNGALDISNNSFVNPVDNTENLGIGSWPNGNQFLNGSMDDVRIYNRALSASEIKQLYNLGR